MAEQLRNPITNELVDEVIKEKEAKERGYFDLQFLLRNLEDENEFVKFFIVKGKKIIVDMDRPHLQYRKPVLIDHERVLQEITAKEKATNISNLPVASTCSLDDEGCVSCSG
jgi:hypothetical protein